MSKLILQPFRRFTYVTAHSPTFPSLHHVTAHSPTFPSLHIRHSSFSIPSVALTTSQLILEPFRHFTYVTAHSPILPLLHLCHSSFSNPSFASPTSQTLHLRHLASLPWYNHDDAEISYVTYLFTIKCVIPRIHLAKSCSTDSQCYFNQFPLWINLLAFLDRLRLMK